MVRNSMVGIRQVIHRARWECGYFPQHLRIVRQTCGTWVCVWVIARKMVYLCFNMDSWAYLLNACVWGTVLKGTIWKKKDKKQKQNTCAVEPQGGSVESWDMVRGFSKTSGPLKSWASNHIVEHTRFCSVILRNTYKGFTRLQILSETVFGS